MNMRQPMVALVLFVVVVVAALASSSFAQRNGARVGKRLMLGKKLFDDLEYRKAIRVLRPVTTANVATRAQRLRAHELIGLSYLTLGNKKRARAAFEDLLSIDPNHRLKDETGSPKIRRFFRRVKRAFVPNAAVGNVELEHAAPSSAAGARRIEMEVSVGHGATRVKEVVVWFRRRGLLRYQHQRFIRLGLRHKDTKVGKRARWRARFTAPPVRQRSALDYYVEAKDIGGRVIGRIAGPLAPLAIPLTAGQVVQSAWYRRWYVIAGTAAALGIGGALIINANNGVKDGSLAPGSIVLTP